MISSLRGKLIHKFRNEIILDVNGVGYHIFISKSLSEKVTDLNSEYFMLTYLDVKENSLMLYGFSDEKEREVFKLLISISGIGAKMSHSILSNLTFGELINVITNTKGFSTVKIPGIGSKKLELISMSLKDKIYRIDADAEIKARSGAMGEGSEFMRFEAMNALMNLGYQRNDAEKIIREVLKQSERGMLLNTEEIIRKALEYISK
ncbi:MAG: Holliday junction ATP-dependent DNA helicase RuvA [Ignavibacteria bacterium]|nr:Holliday junction ATP-dependent DNA helicase RuvA [Ignavibacteria bacterium]